MAIRSPKWAVLTTLSVSFFLIAGCGGESPTKSAPPVATEIFSYAAITGDWEGVLEGGGTEFWAEISITRESATRGEVVGSALELSEENGNLICELEFLAEDSHPPVFWFDYTIIDGEPNCGLGTVRWEYDAATETVTQFFRPEDGSTYYENGSMTRVSS